MSFVSPKRKTYRKTPLNKQTSNWGLFSNLGMSFQMTYLTTIPPLGDAVSKPANGDTKPLGKVQHFHDT